MISQTHNEILKQKNFTGSEFEGALKLLKAFFSRLFYELKIIQRFREFDKLFSDIYMFIGLHHEITQIHVCSINREHHSN